MSAQPLSPPRLHVILARQASKAVIIRRGPTRHFRLSLWHTGTDTFEHGQWLKASSVYAYRCDLSPDGEHFIYFALAGWGLDRAYAAYTAVSRPPYFTALALWGSNSTWGGGGAFKDNSTVMLAFSSAPDEGELPRKVKFESYQPSGDFISADYEAAHHVDLLRRSGWHLQVNEPPHNRSDFTGRILYRDHQHYRLEKRYLGYFPDRFGDNRKWEYALTDLQLADINVLESVEWADWDHQGRLVAAKNGQLWALDPDSPNAGGTLLADFNGQTFEPIASPDWARVW